MPPYATCSFPCVFITVGLAFRSLRAAPQGQLRHEAQGCDGPTDGLIHVGVTMLHHQEALLV